MTFPISPEDHALIEHTRTVNKTLSVLVFALQEGGNIPAESQVDIADTLVALADTIRARACQESDTNGSTTPFLDRAATRLQIEARGINTEQSRQLPSGRCG